MVEVAGGVWESGWIGSAACVAVLAWDESRGATSCSLVLAPTQSLCSLSGLGTGKLQLTWLLVVWRQEREESTSDYAEEAAKLVIGFRDALRMRRIQEIMLQI